MAEYIDRECILRKFNAKDMTNFEGTLILLDDARDLIQKQPAADVAPVVRCRDCLYHHDCDTHFCSRLGMDCPDDSDFFCSYGKRKDGEG